LVVSLNVSLEKHHFGEIGYFSVMRDYLIRHFAETHYAISHHTHQFINVDVLIHVEVKYQE
jgi:hypothetical protein